MKLDAQRRELAAQHYPLARFLARRAADVFNLDLDEAGSLACYVLCEAAYYWRDDGRPFQRYAGAAIRRALNRLAEARNVGPRRQPFDADVPEPTPREEINMPALLFLAGDAGRLIREHYLEGRKYVAIAAEVGLTKQAIQSRAARALRRMRRAWQCA